MIIFIINNMFELPLHLAENEEAKKIKNFQIKILFVCKAYQIEPV